MASVKADFIAYAAREKDRILDDDQPEEMDDVLARYVNHRLGCGNPRDRQLAPDVIAAVAEDATAAVIVGQHLRGQEVINQIVIPGMLAQWAEGRLDALGWIEEQKEPKRPVSPMRWALRYLVIDARDGVLTEEERKVLATFQERFAGHGEPLDDLVRRAAIVLAQENPEIAKHLMSPAASV